MLSTDHPIITRYIDPHGSTFELHRSGDEWVVTQYRTGHPTRVVATGPVDRLRAMLTTWAEDEDGQREPIVLDREGRLIDGRNRARACEQLGVAPTTRHYLGADIVEFIVSENVPPPPSDRLTAGHDRRPNQRRASGASSARRPR